MRDKAIKDNTLKDKVSKNRLIFLLTLTTILAVVLMVNILLAPTASRYIKEEKDKIVAYYTKLYMESDGHDKTAALENNTGSVDFKLMNFIDDNVTQRDIEYTVDVINKIDGQNHDLTQFYDKDGNEIDNITDGDDLYLLDVWGIPQQVGSDTYKYRIDVAKNDGEVNTQTGNYLFSYEKLGASAVGKTHSVSLNITRIHSEAISGTENITIVIRIVKPYTEIFLIDVEISNMLITFSDVDVEKFEIGFKRIYVQTVDIFSHYKGSNDERYVEGNNTKTYVTSRAMKVTFTWTDYLLDEKRLVHFHNGTIGGNDADNLDITKPYIISVSDNELSLYIPESSSFYLDFLYVGSDTVGTIDVDIEVYVDIYTRANSTAEYTFSESKYINYDQTIYGYIFTDKYSIIK